MESSTILNKNNSLSLKKTLYMHDQSIKKISGYHSFCMHFYFLFSLIDIPIFYSFFFFFFCFWVYFFFQVKVGQTQPIQVNLFFNFLQVSKGYYGLWDGPIPAVRGWCTPRKACRFQKRKKCHPRNELLAWYLFS